MTFLFSILVTRHRSGLKLASYGVCSSCLLHLILFTLSSHVFRYSEPQTRRLLYRSLFWIIVSVILWVTDRINCPFWLELRFPYLHVFFHVTVLEGSYVGAVLCAYMHARNQGFSQAEIRYWPNSTSFYGVPYVTVENHNYIDV